MKPISVRFKNFGPYKKEVCVNFEELEKKGLFLICGETGAGKTTILDAICYALYGKSSGGIRGELGVMRCKMAEPSEETRVEFTFDVEGRRYRFLRTLHYGRKNLIDTHNCMVVEGEREIPIFENPKIKNVNQKAEELLGLSYEQFRQVIILPQGQFEKLLISDSTEKEKLLVSLFKAEKWQTIAEEMYRRIAEKDKALKWEAADMKSRLSDYQCETLSELEEVEIHQKEVVSQLKSMVEEAEKREEKQRIICEQTARFHEQFTELTKWKQKKQLLLEQEDGFLNLERALAKADQADIVKPEYDAWIQMKEHLTACGTKKQQLSNRLHEARENCEKVQRKLEAHEAGKTAYEEGVKNLALYENARNIYTILNSRKQQLEEAEGLHQEKKKAWNIQQKRYEASHQNWLNKMKKQKEEMEEYTQMQCRYLEGISGTLAEKLQDGHPCPVCGSLEHPSPALAEERTVTEQKLNQKNRDMQAANQEVEKAAKERERQEILLQQALQEEQEAGQKVIAHQIAWEEIKRQKIEGIETEKELNHKINDLRNRIEKYKELTIKFQNYLSEMRSSVLAMEEAYKQAKEEYVTSLHTSEEQETRCRDAIKKVGFSSLEEFEHSLWKAEEKNQKKAALLRFQAEKQSVEVQIQEREERIQNQKRGNLPEEQKKLAQVQEEQKKASKDWILAQQALERLQKDLKNLKKRQERYQEERKMADANLEFTSRLRGRTGISLQRYVLGVMLSSVTVEANRLLKHVHGGRYQLYRTNAIAGSGQKGGLELEVLDAQSNERRSVTTLSGGEKFLVALSLAIGLSTIVQAQGNGIRLGAMFIDEGFGSLDQNSVYDALEVLQGIQKANGLVGIISHVDLLKEVIPSRIEVKKSRDGREGSTLSVVV